MPGTAGHGGHVVHAAGRTGRVTVSDGGATIEIETWPVEEAIKHANDPNVIFVDLRDVRELWREGTIPGSTHAPRGMLEFWACPESPRWPKDANPNSLH